MTKCLENFVSQTLGFITRFCAAELRINTMIAEYARGMRGIQFSQSFITDLFSLINDAMFIYKDNYHLKEIEDYVIANIRA